MLRRAGVSLPGLVVGNQFFPEGIVQEHFLQKIGVALLRSGRIDRVDGQPDRKGGAKAVLTVRVDAAAVVVNDEITRHQMDAVLHRAIAAHHKRIKDQSQGLFRQTGPVIAHLDLDV